MKKLYIKGIVLIGVIDKIIFYLRTQNYDAALRKSTVFIDQLEEYMRFLKVFAGQDRVEILVDLLKGLFQVQENKDYILLADLYEIQMRSFFLEIQNEIVNIDGFNYRETCFLDNRETIKQIYPELSDLIYSEPNLQNLTEQGYEVEFTACGHMTLAISDKGMRYYLHSNGRVLDEAFNLASSWIQEDKTNYIVYGYGLGYHIKELLELDSNITVEVYEADLNVLKIASAYTEIRHIIKNPMVKLIYDPDFSKLLKRISQLNNNTNFIIHYPSLRNIKNTIVKDKFEQYFIQYSSVKNQERILNGNFKINIKHYDGLVDELKDVFQGKDLYIVAAGPSLDKNYLQLKEIGEKGIILATGTVFKKLSGAGIKPNYVVVTDANERVYGQVAGLETSGVPLLFISTAYKGFAINYKGKKYMICQKDFNKAELFASENGTMLFNTGGSVSTTALDIGIAFGCKRIIFLGLDLAYSDNFVHAADTSQRELASTNDLRQVEDINGNMIYTSKSLDMYRKWIENRIKGVNDIEFIDATEGGAKIEGMKIMKLSDCINLPNNCTNS